MITTKSKWRSSENKHTERQIITSKTKLVVCDMKRIMPFLRNIEILSITRFYILKIFVPQISSVLQLLNSNLILRFKNIELSQRFKLASHKTADSFVVKVNSQRLISHLFLLSFMNVPFVAFFYNPMVDAIFRVGLCFISILFSTWYQIVEAYILICFFFIMPNHKNAFRNKMKIRYFRIIHAF